MGELICEGISVVEAGAGSIAGSMIGMMLADNGAHVTKLEPPAARRVRLQHRGDRRPQRGRGRLRLINPR